MLRAFSPSNVYRPLTQAFSLGWYLTATLALIRSPQKYTAIFRRANGPIPYQHGVKPHEPVPSHLERAESP